MRVLTDRQGRRHYFSLTLDNGAVLGVETVALRVLIAIPKRNNFAEPLMSTARIVIVTALGYVVVLELARASAPAVVSEPAMAFLVLEIANVLEFPMSKVVEFLLELGMALNLPSVQAPVNFTHGALECARD